MDLLAWRDALNVTLDCTEENVFTRIEMGQATTFFARKPLGPPLLFSSADTRFGSSIVHIRYNWAMATLCASVLRHSNEMVCVEWLRQIIAICQESWLSVADVGDTLLGAIPDFVPEDPTREVRLKLTVKLKLR